MPAGSIDLARIPHDALAGAAVLRHVTDSTECRVSATYSNVTSIVWQRNNAAAQLGNPDAPKALRTPLPTRMLVTTLTSNALPLETSE